MRTLYGPQCSPGVGDAPQAVGRDGLVVEIRQRRQDAAEGVGGEPAPFAINSSFRHVFWLAVTRPARGGGRRRGDRGATWALPLRGPSP